MLGPPPIYLPKDWWKAHVLDILAMGKYVLCDDSPISHANILRLLLLFSVVKEREKERELGISSLFVLGHPLTHVAVKQMNE